MKPTLRIKQRWPEGHGKPVYQAYSSHPQIHVKTGWSTNVGNAYIIAKRKNICASHV